MSIKENDFRKVDLNLLVTLLVLLRERSVSRAAERLHLGQPAISAALARLRELFDDELLVRAGRDMLPTVKALELEAALTPALQHIQSTLFETAIFDPATAERTFTLGMTDWVEVWLMPRLFARLQQLAPGVHIAVRASDPFQGTAMLEKEEMDLGVSRFVDGPAWQKKQVIKTIGYSCIYDRKLVPTKNTISLQQYIAHAHLLVTYRSALQGTADHALAELGLKRNIRYTTPRFSTMPGILQMSPAIATVPEVLARYWHRQLGLHMSPVPVELPQFTVEMIWHAKRDADPALTWLRGLIEELVAADD